MNFRYAAVWNEVNSRIALRQNAVTMFVTLSCAIITIMLTQGTGTQTPNQNSLAIINPRYFSGLMPCVSIVFALLNYKHDKTIALLRQFLKEAEELMTVEYDLKLLGYNSDTLYRPVADDVRKLHDFTCAALIALFNGVAGFVAFGVLPNESRVSGALLTFYFLVVVACIIGVMRSTWWPHKFPRSG
jgi:hypothetical protein